MIAITAVLVAGLVASQPAVSATAANPTGSSPCGAAVNAIVCENQKPGTDPTVWDIDGAGDPSIQGFATDISVNVGQKIDFKIDTKATSYKIDVYRTGWYQGLGARFIQSVPVTAALPQNQPQCISDITTELYDCGTWGVSASWNVPADAVSGVYIAKLTRNDTGGSSHIIFIVRNDGNTSQVLFQTSDPTWHAYNTYGGSDFYQGAANGRAYKISYNRPFATRGTASGRDFYFASEYATVRFLERNGYDTTYIAGLDTDRRGGELKNHKVFLSVGHDEYWSGAQRANIEAARDAGVNLQFLTGNEGYWRTRYEPSADGSNTPQRTLVSYKETWGNDTKPKGGKIDPSTEWTGTWRDPRYATAAQGGASPENAVTGTMYMVNDDDLAVTVSADEGKLRLWRNTSLTSLAAGTSAALAAHTIGYESNEDIDNGFRPAGLIRLSTTVGPTPQYLRDYGNIVTAGTTEHHLTLYRAPSGALVFSAASIQWSWGLDQTHDGNGAPADPRMQQAQINLLADMGAQPGSLMSGLVAATKSTDTTPPIVTIQTPAAGTSIAQGASVTTTGTATDAAGRVAAVEVSVDGGTTWRMAQGTTSWSYTYIQQGEATIKVRAVDDSANYSAAGTSRPITVTGPASIFGVTAPAVASADDNQGAELGLRFTAANDGFITGVRFYKGTANTGTHVGSVWDSAGNRLGTVTFTNESASGWQTAQFTSAIAVTAGTPYVVSYTAPNGGYAMQERYWPYQARPSSPLSVPSGVGDAAPGVFAAPGRFPNSAYIESNYFVDVLFSASDTTPLRVSARAPLAGSSSVATDTPITATFSRAIAPASLAFTLAGPSGPVAGAVSYDAATRTARFTPSAALAANTTFTATPVAQDANGVGLEAGSAWTFTTRPVDVAEGQCPCSLFAASSTPEIASVADNALVTLGVTFSPNVAGTVTALRYYKGTSNTGTHVGTLWAADRTKLATVTFSNEGAQGWQTATLSTPVSLQAGATYIASYIAPAGNYAATAGAFSSSYTRGPLTVPASGAVYTYSDGFPASSSSTDYGVDVVFAPAVAAPTLAALTPSAGAVDVPATSAAITAAYTLPIKSGYSGSVFIGSTAVAGAWSLSSDAKTISFVPSAPLPSDASVQVSITGIQGANGAAVPDTTWTFSTVSTSAQPTVTLLGTQTPQVASETGDTSSVELGMSFRTSVSGEVRAVRFYKGAGNTGTHVGSLWGPNGERLAQVTFVNETASGWQRAVFSSAVSIAPGVVYTVSYLAPNGRYSYTSASFASPVTSGPLTAESTQNGRYRYGTGGQIPTSSFNATNYFVDVEFTAVDTAPRVISVAPARAGTTAPVATNVWATFDRDVATSSATISLTGPNGVVPGATSYDAATKRILLDPTTDLAFNTAYTVVVALGATTVDTWTFSTVASASTGVAESVFGDQTPETAAVSDTASIEVGTAFRVTEAGNVTALRFYKGPGNTGTHVGSLWASTGERLAQVTFTNEGSTGWQRATLTTPVPVVPGRTYVASYLAPVGGYAVTPAFFTSERGSDRVLGLSDANGRYLYGAGGAMPTNSWNASAYFVDAEVTFGVLPAAAPAVTATTPAADATGVPVDVAISATISNATAATLAVTSDGAAVAGASSFDAATGKVTFTPSAPLARGKGYSVTASANGSVVANGTWSFSTKPVATLGTTTPAAGAANVDPTSIAIKATLNNAQAATLTLTTGGANVAGASSYDAATGVATFTPASALDWSRSYSVTVVADSNPVAGGTWSFTTAAKPAITARTPASAATSVDPATAKVTATLTNATTASISLTLGGANVAGASALNTSTGVVTFTPTVALDWSKTYTATVLANGAAVTSGSWSFTTMAKQDQVSLFTSAGTPSNANTTTARAMQIGTRFTTSAPGVVTAIRFYKGNLNTGTHTGYLWSATGTRLATVTFTGETASGWQTATLSAPVRLTVGTEYRVSMYSSSGRYPATTSGLSAVRTSGPLSTIARGGVYVYGTTLPNTTSTTNYWVDVIFDPDN